MKYILYIFTVTICASTAAQISERERVYILQNYIEDIGVCSNCSKEQYMQAISTVLDHQQIEVSPRHIFMREAIGWEKSIADSIQYSIRFYRIRGDNRIGNLYLAHLTDDLSRQIDVWLRLSGWRENDMRFLCKMYEKNGLGKPQLEMMVNSWVCTDSIAQEAQLDKIFRGASNNEMNDDCFISEHYKLLDGLRHRDMGPTDNKDLYSTFSRQPMGGMWVEY